MPLTAGNALAEENNPELVERGYAGNPSTAQIVLKGADILGGYGVAVVYPLQGPLDYSGYMPFQFQCTAGGCYQCIEFVLWLYDQQLGYAYQWPGSIWSPYQLIGVVQSADQVAYQVEHNGLSPQNTQYLLYKDYTDLSYYPNGSSTPPQPGDILITADGSHSMIVNRVGGDQLEVVQQNAWEVTPNPQPTPLEMRQVTFFAGTYTVQNSLGWIHSPRWAEKLTQIEPVQVSGASIAWSRHTDSLQVSLSSDYILKLAASPLGEVPYQIARKLSNSGALSFTHLDYVTCVFRRLGNLLQSEGELNPENGVTALEITIPYFGSQLFILPNGGPENGHPLNYQIAACS